MNAIAEILRSVLPPGIEIPDDISEERLAQRRSDAYNQLEGNLTGYDCRRCRNKGYISEIADGTEVMHRCDCHLARESLARIERSGLGRLCKRCTFEAYRAEQTWQQAVLAKAQAYAADPDGWFAVTGQSGGGKTHICTAITYSLIMSGREAIYMQWTHEATHLKSIVGDAAEYQRRMDELRDADVLYIDDLLKGAFTAADVKLAFDILNHRAYKELTTIISSELTPQQILAADEAVMGRLAEMCNSNYFCIKKDRRNNYRLRRENYGRQAAD